MMDISSPQGSMDSLPVRRRSSQNVLSNIINNNNNNNNKTSSASSSRKGSYDKQPSLSEDDVLKKALADLTGLDLSSEVDTDEVVVSKTVTIGKIGESNTDEVFFYFSFIYLFY